MKIFMGKSKHSSKNHFLLPNSKLIDPLRESMKTNTQNVEIRKKMFFYYLKFEKMLPFKNHKFVPV